MQSISRMQVAAQLQILVATPDSCGEKLNQHDGVSIYCKTSYNSVHAPLITARYLFLHKPRSSDSEKT